MKALLSLLCGACAIPTGPIALSDQLNPTARSPEFAPLPSSAGERAERSSGTSSCQANGCNGCWIHGECDPLDEPGNLAYSKVHCETGAAYCGTLGTYCGPNVLNTAELQAQLANSNAALANSNAELEIVEAELANAHTKLNAIEAVLAQDCANYLYVQDCIGSARAILLTP